VDHRLLRGEGFDARPAARARDAPRTSSVAAEAEGARPLERHVVESPIVQAFVDETLERVRVAVRDLRLRWQSQGHNPRQTTRLGDLIGPGVPCTERASAGARSMKIRRLRGTSTAGGEGGKAILLLGSPTWGVRESCTHRGPLRHGERLNNHNDVANCPCVSPIVELFDRRCLDDVDAGTPPWAEPPQAQ